jgi:hypothetical protein
MSYRSVEGYSRGLRSYQVLLQSAARTSIPSVVLIEALSKLRQLYHFPRSR